MNVLRGRMAPGVAAGSSRPSTSYAVAATSQRSHPRLLLSSSSSRASVLAHNTAAAGGNSRLASASMPLLPLLRRRAARRAGGVVRSSSSGDDATSTSAQATESGSGGDARIKSTMADLDALLGIVPEPEEEPSAAASSSSAASTEPLSGDALQSAIAAEAQRLAAGVEGTSPEMDGLISDQMKKILGKAKQLAADDKAAAGGAPDAASQAQLRKEFEELLSLVFSAEQGVDKADVAKLKDSGVFGPLSFWVTEMRNLDDLAAASGGAAAAGPGGAPAGGAARAGVLVRGNLRAPRAVVFAAVVSKVKELFGDKYTVLMVEDPDAGGGGGGPDDAPLPRRPADASSPSGAASSSNADATSAPEPRVAFQLVPSALATPPQSSGWRTFVSAVLSLLLFGSCVQLALVANITKLPKETLDYLAAPDAPGVALGPDGLPPGLAGWDPEPYLACVLPIFAAVVGVNFLHELGHRVAAWARGVKLGPSFFIPNLQIGSFGAITPFASLLKGRRELWDVAAAGPLAGGLGSLGLLLVGLSQSAPGDGQLPAELLVPVPTQLFQGSLLLGTITRAALGDAATHGNETLLSPLAIAGWCGLITTALNLLPVGSLDGGRMVQAAFGQQALSLSSFFTYVGLGLGLLGSSLSLPFGLYVLICQRTAERYVQDSVSPLGDASQRATAIAVLTAVLVLLPMAPELADSVGVSAGGGADLFL